MLLDMLHHTAESFRCYAAQSLWSIYYEVASVAVPGMKSSSQDHLGLLLTLLAGNDAVPSRCSYARLLGQLAKRIGQAGAVPYLLTLLSQAETAEDKYLCLECIKVRALNVCLVGIQPIDCRLSVTLQFIDALLFPSRCTHHCAVFAVLLHSCNNPSGFWSAMLHS